MPVGVSLPFFTFGPSWVAHLSSWGPPQSIFFHGLEDSYGHFNLGQRVETRGILGVVRGLDRQKWWGLVKKRTSVSDHGLARVE
jgi:hypothetical protein